MYAFDASAAKEADQIQSGINETGKYIGTITRAEKLLSNNGTPGLGLSFKSDSGQTADYLDLYTHKKDGETLPSFKTVQAILGVLQLREIKDGKIKCVKYDKNTKSRDEVVVDGFPELMGKKIGFLLQKELGTNTNNGNDTERMVIFGVFQADTELTVSELLNRKTKPETLPKMMEALMARPVRDNRKKTGSYTPPAGTSDYDAPAAGHPINDDVPW